MEDRSMFFGASGEIFAKAKALRLNTTETEKLLWEKIGQNQLSGFRFKRQHPIAHYIVDFYCHKAKLIIELDGGYHNEADQMINDEFRTDELTDLGLMVLRFSNEEVRSRMEEVIKRISDYLNETARKMSPNCGGASPAPPRP
jgi:very-short-patch-repair endonuclease